MSEPVMKLLAEWWIITLPDEAPRGDPEGVVIPTAEQMAARVDPFYDRARADQRQRARDAIARAAAAKAAYEQHEAQRLREAIERRELNALLNTVLTRLWVLADALRLNLLINHDAPQVMSATGVEYAVSADYMRQPPAGWCSPTRIVMTALTLRVTRETIGDGNLDPRRTVAHWLTQLTEQRRMVNGEQLREMLDYLSDLA